MLACYFNSPSVHMKLTKGRIHKLLSIRKQTFKRSRNDYSSNKESSHNFTARNKQPMNLMKKTLHNYKSINNKS